MSAASSAAQPADERDRLAAAVARAPRDPALRHRLALALARSGEHCVALDQYLALLELVPDNPDAAADAGLMARKCGREEEVLPLVTAAAAAHSAHARIWQVSGLLHRAIEDLEPAVAALDRASRLAPTDPLIAHGHARATLESGRPAASLFEKAARLSTADDSVPLGLIAAMTAEARQSEATALLQGWLRHRPDWVAGHATLARLRWETGDRDDFAASLEQALQALPRNMNLWRELLALLMHAGRYDEALDAIARGRLAAGSDRLFDANEAICHAEKGEFAIADRLFASLALDDDPTVAVRRVRHLLRTGRPEQAMTAAEPWLADPAAHLFWPYLAIAWRQLGDPRWEWLEADARLVGIYDLTSDLPPLDRLADCLRTLHIATFQPLEQSLRGGTQTDGPLFARVEPEIRALRKAVVEAVRTHIAQLSPPDPRHPQLRHERDRPVRFSGSWSVRLTGGGRHANHIHPAGWFSSALYVALPDHPARGPEPAGWLTLGEPQAEIELDLEPFRLIEPQPGRLVLFPSTMWHGTRPFAEGERLTVAFDVAPPA